jgi:hypothetical protein
MASDPSNSFFATEPGGREAAPPGPLALVQAFVNTREAERGWEALADPASLRRWMVGRGLLAVDESVAEADVRKARGVREMLRAMLVANNGGKTDARSIEMLNRAARRAKLGVRFGADGRSAVEPGSGGVDGALGGILAAVHGGMEAGTWGA